MANNHSALWYFERFGLLSGLSDDQKLCVERHARMLHVQRGQAIYLPGDPSQHVYVVKVGAVKIVGSSPEGSEVILALLMPGDILGELALLGDDEPQEHRAEAVDDTVLCEVPRELMFRLIEETPAFGRHVSKLVGLRLRTFRTRVGELLGKSAPARLAHAILELSDQHGIRDGGGVLLPLRLSQGDLGKLVGLTRETVNGILQVWRHQGVMEMDRRSIRLRDPDRLRRVR
ncbi:MAG: Crp/Fnr family transcriptional regulator [Acidobacteria bacterium]|nr:Crp/Fnr family transcriptional regulator [Acidobacteriota bacterium]